MSHAADARDLREIIHKMSEEERLALLEALVRSDPEKMLLALATSEKEGG